MATNLVLGDKILAINVEEHTDILVQQLIDYINSNEKDILEKFEEDCECYEKIWTNYPKKLKNHNIDKVGRIVGKYLKVKLDLSFSYDQRGDCENGIIIKIFKLKIN